MHSLDVSEQLISPGEGEVSETGPGEGEVSKTKGKVAVIVHLVAIVAIVGIFLYKRHQNNNGISNDNKGANNNRISIDNYI